MKPVFYDNASSVYGIFENAISNYLKARLSVCIAVEVVSIEGNFATVKPLISHLDTTGKQINLTDDDNIPNVPIMFFSGAFGSFKFKVNPKDKGLLIASNCDISNYKKNHSQSVVASSRSFSFSDGFFIPLDFGGAGNNLIIKNNNSSLEMSNSEIIITASGFKIKGKTEISGDLEVEGKIRVKEGLETEGKIKAKGEVEGNNIKLSLHKHTIAGTPPICPQATGTPTP